MEGKFVNREYGKRVERGGGERGEEGNLLSVVKERLHHHATPLERDVARLLSETQ